MLTDDQVMKKSRQFVLESDMLNLDNTDYYYSGYKDCQVTIPPESIGFAEWIRECDYIHGSSEDRKWYNAWGIELCENTEQLYNIYLNQLNNNNDIRRA